MKIVSLLAQFLYTHKRLDLPGIGTFLVTQHTEMEPEKQKHDKPAGMESVSFESNSSLKESPDLVQFIADKSGKIRALAAADLDSHLALAKQFLNIGNPFLFEGIGTIEKIKSGEYTLKPGTGFTEKTKDNPSRERVVAPDNKSSQNDYKNVFYSPAKKKKWRKPAVLILVIAGMALAVWGGYTVYKNKKTKNSTAPADNNQKDISTPVSDTSNHSKNNLVTPPQNIDSGLQKFILEICDKERALKRFSQLKGYQWNVQLETKDSVTFKLFMLLPATVSDTSRIIDSLSAQTGRRVFISQ